MLMERQLDAVAGGLLQQVAGRARHRCSCCRRRPRRSSATRRPRHRRALRATAPNSPADLVVMAVGIRPNIELAEKAGLHCNRGIVVNDTMQTYDRAHLRGRRMRRSTAASPTAWSRRCSSMAKVCANHLAMDGIGRLRRLGDLDQAQGHRHRPVLRRRFRGRRRHAKRSCCSDADGGVYKRSCCGQEDRRRRALRRHRRRRLVLPAAARRHATYRRHPRPADVRRSQSRRRRSRTARTRSPPWPTTTESAAATASARARSSRRSRRRGLFTLDDVRAHTKASPPAAPAPAWSSRC